MTKKLSLIAIGVLITVSTGCVKQKPLSPAETQERQQNNEIDLLIKEVKYILDNTQKINMNLVKKYFNKAEKDEKICNEFYIFDSNNKYSEICKKESYYYDVKNMKIFPFNIIKKILVEEKTTDKNNTEIKLFIYLNEKRSNEIISIEKNSIQILNKNYIFQELFTKIYAGNSLEKLKEYKKYDFIKGIVDNLNKK